MNYKNPVFIGTIVSFCVFFLFIGLLIFLWSRYRRTRFYQRYRKLSPRGRQEYWRRRWELKRRDATTWRFNPRQRGPECRPPVFHVDDLDVPPPVYRKRPRRPALTGIELVTLREKLQKLEEDTARCEDAFEKQLMESEIRNLKSWLHRIGNLGAGRRSEDLFVSGTYYLDEQNRRSWVQPETLWYGIGPPREVRPYPEPDRLVASMPRRQQNMFEYSF